MTLQRRLRALREDRDLRQVDVSLATGIDQRTLSNYETGKTNPDSQALVLLADYFHVSIDYLVGRHATSITNPKDILQLIDGLQQQLEELKQHLQ